MSRKLNTYFIFLIGVVGVSISLFSFNLIGNNERSQFYRDLNEDSLTYVLFLRESLLTNFQILNSYNAFYHASEYVSREGFNTFSEKLFKDEKSIQAFEWIPRVKRGERNSYRHLARTSGFADFQITEKDTEGNMVLAGEREEYFPVHYLYPYEGNEKALGFDLGSNQDRLDALKKSRDSGDIVASKHIRLVQETGEQFAFLVFKAVYSKGALHETVDQRRKNLAGFALAVFRVGDLLETAIRKQTIPRGIDIYIFENSELSDTGLLYFHPSRIHKSPVKPEPITALLSRDHVLYEISVANQKWVAIMKPALGYAEQQNKWLPWFVLFVGVMLTTLLTFFYVSVSGRTTYVEKEVKDRTKELRQLGKDLITARDEAENANMSKTEFLANMSHDLRTPLNAIMGFSEMMKDKIFGPLGDPHYEEYAKDIFNSGSLLISLIDDILDISKVEAGKYKLNEEILDVSSLIQSSIKMISTLAETGKLHIATSIEPNLPMLRGDDKVITQILNNVLSNAVKFTPTDGKITVSAKVDDDGCINVLVADTGEGMSEQTITKAIKPFEQADSTHSKLHKGTGLGLHLCQNLVKLHDGDIKLQSKVGKGTTVTVRFPPERTVVS